MLHAVIGARASARRLTVALALSAAAVVAPLAGEASAATPAPAPAVTAAVVAVSHAAPLRIERAAAVKRRAALRRAALARRVAVVHARKVKTVLKTAAALKGRPYVWGATGPRAFDCSGFTGWVMRHAGRSLPRTASEQYAASKKISKRSMKPGDLVFFRSGRSVYHVALYAGHNRIWHARQPGQGVALTPIGSHSWVPGRVI